MSVLTDLLDGTLATPLMQRNERRLLVTKLASAASEMFIVTNFKISETGAELRISVDDLGEKQATALKALQECAEGRCTCPTPQYEKMQSIDVVPGQDRIDIKLTAKPGESIDRQAIDKCLEYTAGQLKDTN